MNKWDGLVAVVTGASSGIGKDVAIKLAQEGMKVAALARREDRLKDLANTFKGKGAIKAYKCDVSDDKAINQVFKDIEQTMGPIRVLVNNAGISPKINLLDFDIDVWRRIYNVNYFGMFECIGALMTYVKKRNSTEMVHIININSIAGHNILDNPSMIVYSSSKHCVTFLTRGLIKQIAKDKLNIRVTSLSPGVVDTEIAKAAGYTDIDFSAIPHLDGKDIADATVSVLSVPENVIISELTIKPKGEIY